MILYEVTRGVGSYMVEGLTASFTVTAPPTDPIWLSPGYFAGIVIIIAVILIIASTVIASVYALYRRGHPPLHNLPKRTPGANNQEVKEEKQE